MIGYLLPVLALSLIVLLLNHQALMANMCQPRIASSVSKHQILHQTKYKEKARLDFIIAGFPKCGTTTLLYAFMRHNETKIGESEETNDCSQSYSFSFSILNNKSRSS
jgi:hypothetical protein